MSAEPRTERRTVAPTPPPLDVLVDDDDEPTLSGLAIAVRALGPGTSGTELGARAMAPSNDEAPYVDFVVVTGHDDRSLELEVMRAGADDFQRKPIDRVQLEARLVSAERVALRHEL